MSTQIEEILVQDVMMNCDSIPVVNDRELFRETIIEMCNYKLGVACIVNAKNQLKGVFTDGDIRRGILSGLDIEALGDQLRGSTNPIDRRLAFSKLLEGDIGPRT